MIKYVKNMGNRINTKLSSFMKCLAGHISVCFAIALIPCPLSAQTYNHDEMVMNQFTVQETGVGTLRPATWYQLTDNSYYRSAAMTNKQLLRTEMALRLESEIKYAEKIDSAMVERASIESKNLTDRMLDVSWQVEKEKVEKKMSVFKANIEKITLLGGTAHDYDNWLDQYNCIQCGLTAIQREYLPNSERQREYLAVYKDVMNKNTVLVRQLLEWRALKEMKAHQTTAKRPLRTDIGNVALEAKGRWKVAWTGGLVSKGK